MTTNKDALDALDRIQGILLLANAEINKKSIEDTHDMDELFEPIRTALLQHNQAQPVNKMMLDALKAIVDYDDTNAICDMRGETGSWQSNELSDLISKANIAIAAASSAPVVDVVVPNLESAIDNLKDAKGKYCELNEKDIRDLKTILDAARLQFARQKGGV